MSIFCCSRQHMCCWWSARVCESEIMWERELQRWVRKRVRHWASRQGVHEKPRLKAVQQAAARGAAERRTVIGEEKRWKGLGKGLGWEDVKQSERVRESEWGGGGGGVDCVVLTKWNRPRGSIWVSAQLKGKEEDKKHGPKWLLWLTHWALGKSLVFFFPCEWSSNIFLSFAELGELMRSLSPSLQTLYVGWKSDVKTCNKSLKVVCGS